MTHHNLTCTPEEIQDSAEGYLVAGYQFYTPKKDTKVEGNFTVSEWKTMYTSYLQVTHICMHHYVVAHTTTVLLLSNSYTTLKGEQKQTLLCSWCTLVHSIASFAPEPSLT